MKKRWLALVILFGVFTAFIHISETLFTVPEGWPEPQYNFESNPLTKEKIELGRALFYDPILSGNNVVSCASCHSPYSSFAHTDHDLSHGIEDRIGKRNAPALMNLAWQNLFMWDGAVNHLDVQALAPISHVSEMDNTIENAVAQLQASSLYPSLFYKAYGDSIITGEMVLKALSQFQLTLVSSHSKYDSVMHEKSVFTPQEANGYALFQQHCNTCHREPLFSTYEFAGNGLPVDTTLNDYGRMTITGKAEDSLKFKIPTLRNIEYTYPYMHDGRFRSLSAVLDHYTKGIRQHPTLAAELREPILLTANEKVDIIAFLLTLSDREFIFNPRHTYPQYIFSGMPKDGN